MKKLVSIIIVNLNGKKWLKKCLGSLNKQSYKNIEIILVDNNSSDGSISYVKENFPKVYTIKLDQNIGFAGGVNKGYEHAKGDYILLLNNDTGVGSNFIENFLNSFASNPRASIIQSKIVWMDNPKKIDSCGSYWTDTSFLYYVGNNKNADLENYNTSFPVFSAKGASLMIKRAVIEKIGLFYDDFWSYYEETDFCHRAWLAGYETWYAPQAVCHHAIGGTSLTFKNEFVQYHNFKNKLASILYNFEWLNLLYIVPIFLLFNLILSIVWFLQGKHKHSFSLTRALFWNLRNLHNTMKRRRNVNMQRKVTDNYYFQIVKRNPRPSYYHYLLNDNLGAYVE